MNTTLPILKRAVIDGLAATLTIMCLYALGGFNLTVAECCLYGLATFSYSITFSANLSGNDKIVALAFPVTLLSVATVLILRDWCAAQPNTRDEIVVTLFTYMIIMAPAFINRRTPA